MGDGVWLALLFSALVGGVLGLIIGSVFEGGTYKAQAIERGYAIYCPADGAWAWKGECGK